MGLGKSHDAGLLQPSALELTSLSLLLMIRVTLRLTLKDWTQLIKGRHGRLVEVPGPNEL